MFGWNENNCRTAFLCHLSNDVQARKWTQAIDFYQGKISHWSGPWSDDWQLMDGLLPSYWPSDTSAQYLPHDPCNASQLAPPAKNWRILLKQSFIAHMPLLTATNIYGLNRRHWSFHQQCYIHHLRIIPILQLLPFEGHFSRSIQETSENSFI